VLDQPKDGVHVPYRRVSASGEIGLQAGLPSSREPLQPTEAPDQLLAHRPDLASRLSILETGELLVHGLPLPPGSLGLTPQSLRLGVAGVTLPNAC